jgi:hypothetical protein
MPLVVDREHAVDAALVGHQGDVLADRHQVVEAQWHDDRVRASDGLSLPCPVMPIKAGP